tara:strand:+ start:24129 stop:24929 length:801 start_codon:yes stop_codon:yes gene_type:complete
MTSIFCLFMFFASYFLISFFNGQSKRKEEMRVKRWHDFRYIKKIAIAYIAKYFQNNDSLLQNIAAAFVFFCELSALSIVLKHTISGGRFHGILALVFMCLAIISIFFMRPKKAVKENYFETHLSLSIMYVASLAILPLLSNTVPLELLTLFSFVLLPVYVIVSYQILRLLNSFRGSVWSNFLNTMFLYVLLFIQFSYVYIGFEYGIFKVIIVWAHATLTTIILLSFNRNIIDRKSETKTKHHIIATGIYGLIIVVFLYGGISWQYL